MSLKAIVFLGSIREERLAERVGKFVQTELESAGFTVEVFGKISYAHLHPHPRQN